MHLIATFEQPKIRSPKRLKTRIITTADIQSLIDHVKLDPSLSDSRKQNYVCQIMFLAYASQRPLTMASIESEQIIHALKQSPPVLTVKAEQDKIRLEHYVPLHPNLLQILRYEMKNINGSIFFMYELLSRYLNKAKISLSRTQGYIQLRDLGRYFEQKSDELGFTDANKNFIMSHRVSSVNWQSYKQFLPGNIYDICMKYWGDVNFIT